ncbi:glycosyltransferase family 9 protein [bacterium]|nr:glycosyltransferase family 9 protein [bacterium]
MKSFLEKNLACLRKKDEDLFRRVSLSLGEKRDREIRIVEAKSGHPTIKARRDFDWIYLASSYNPRREATNKLKDFRPKGRGVIFLGLGPGYLPLSLLSSSPSSLPFFVVEESLDIFIAALSAVDLEVLFEEVRVEFLIDLKLGQVRERIEEHNLLPSSLFVISGYRLKDHPFYQQLSLELETDFISFSKIEKPDPKILVIQLNTAGDVLRATPVLRGLKEKYPQSRISFLVEDAYSRILRGNPYLDRLIALPRKESQLSEAIGEKLEGEEFDLVVNLNIFNPASARLTSLIKAGDVIGTRLDKEGQTQFIDLSEKRAEIIQELKGYTNRAYLYLFMAGVSPTKKVPCFQVEEEDKNCIAGLLRDYRVGEEDFLVVLQPGCGWEDAVWREKRLDEEEVARIGDALSKELGARIVLVGAEIEKERAGKVAGLMREEAINLAGRTNYRQLGALLLRADLGVFPDSFPMHLSVALDRPTIAIFGATTPALYGPVGDGFIALLADLPCAVKGCRYGCQERKCLKMITEEVILKAYQLLKAAKTSDWEETERLKSEIKERGVRIFG